MKINDGQSEERYEKYLEEVKAALLEHGRVNVRWVSSRGAYAFYSGRRYVPTGQSFDTEAECWEWLKETLGIEKQ